MKKGKGQYPSKVSINLVIKEKGQFNPGRVLPMLAAVILAALCFGKFAVADRLAQVADARSALNAAVAHQTALENATVDFESMLDEYNRYSSGWMSDEEKALVDRMETVDLIQAELMSAATVKQFAISGSVLTADLSGVSLEKTSRIVERLYTHDIVSQVDVYTAAASQEPGGETAAETAVVSLIITLTNGMEGGEEQ